MTVPVNEDLGFDKEAVSGQEATRRAAWRALWALLLTSRPLPNVGPDDPQANKTEGGDDEQKSES